MKARQVHARVQLEEHRVSAAFTSYGLRGHIGGPAGLSLDPFLNLDDFHMSEPTFPPHPHAGFSAVTYMFEDSRGSFINRDSLGDRSVIEPGALHWTQAARGMMHEEIPEHPGTDCHGLQMFVNLRSDHKRAAPRAFHVSAREVPEVRPTAGARVRVLAGTYEGSSSPLTELLTPTLLLDVHLEAGASVNIPVPREWTAFLLAIRGSGEAGPGASVAAHQALGFARDGESIALHAGAPGLQVLVGAGQPLGEPVVFGGPFAMTDRQELAQAAERFQRGEMGRLTRSF